ncbi:hypothetical protein V3C99_012061 [Haemonchus contortus]
MVYDLRVWGVFFILLFNHYTEMFPNCYIGADIIIVVSGFLAGCALRDEHIDNATVKEFWMKRTRWLLQIYYLAVFLILVSCYLLLPISYQQTNLEKARTAMFLISNIKLPCSGDNFSNTLPSIEDAFGHTWLPCLLIQWHIIAPILFWIQRRVTDRDFVFFAGISASFLGLSLLPKKLTASYWIYCRLWQLCAGTSVAVYSSQGRGSSASIEEGKSSSMLGAHSFSSGSDIEDRSGESARSFKSEWMRYGLSFLRHPVLFLPLLIPMFWFRFTSFDLRLYITVATTLLLYVSNKNEEFPLFTSRLTTDLGEMLYPLYLAHWPIYSFARYHADVLHSSVECGIGISIGVGLLSHHHLRRLYAHMSPTVTKVIYIAVVVATVVLSMKTIKFRNNDLHYLSISVQDTICDIVNAIY